MKIISIISGRKNGNTERVVRRIQEDILQIANKKNLQVEFEQVDLAGSDLKMCRGCRICFNKGEDSCPLKDTLLTIRDKISHADGVILASPVFVEDVNGTMKNWIDRMAFNCHRPAFAGKTAVVVTTSAGGSSNHALNTMKSALLAWGFHVSAQSKFRTGAIIDDAKIRSHYDNEIKVFANKFLASISKAEHPSFYSLLVFKVQQKFWQKADKDQNCFDYRYWKDKGWFEKSCSYYTRHNSSYIKIKLAGLAGNIVALFFI